MAFKNNSKAVKSYSDKELSDADIKDGYCIEPLDPLANMYSNEHNTTFYDNVKRTDKRTGKTVEGFLELGNFLDRL